jgi:hypothetical protein
MQSCRRKRKGMSFLSFYRLDIELPCFKLNERVCVFWGMTSLRLGCRFGGGGGWSVLEILFHLL